MRIVTHSGSFHADDVFAVAALTCIEKYANAEIVRTRDLEVIASGDCVADVGNIYEESSDRFDHHQQGGAGVRPNGIPYSSFGLVWKKYGAEIAGSVEAAQRVDQRLVQPIDAHDNGIELASRVRKDVFPYALNDCIRAFNATWKEGPDDSDRLFAEAVSVASRIVAKEARYARDLIEGESFVREAYVSVSDKRIVVMDRKLPWADVLNAYPEPLFAVYPDASGGGWSVQCVRDDVHDFASRKDMPAAWAAKRGTELAGVSGVPDAVFCHVNRFFAVAKSKEGAVRLAELAAAA